MGNQSSLLRARRIRVGAGAQQPPASAAGTNKSKPLPPAGPFRPLPASAGILLGVEASSRIRYTTLAALLKATPASCLLTAQRQRLVTIHTATKSLRSAFLKLIDAQILSAPVYDDDAREWIGFLDVRDLIDLVLLRYLCRREGAIPIASASASAFASASASASASTPSACAKLEAMATAKSSEQKQTMPSATCMTDDKSNSVTAAVTVTGTATVTAIATATATATAAATAAATVSTPLKGCAPCGSGAAGALKVGSIHAPDFVDDALVHATDAEVDISIRSLAERRPWKPLPSTATLFDVAKELLTDVRRVPIVDTIITANGNEQQQLIGVVTQSAIISFLSAKMTEVSSRGHHIRVPFVTNPVASAVADAEGAKTNYTMLLGQQQQQHQQQTKGIVTGNTPPVPPAGAMGIASATVNPVISSANALTVTRKVSGLAPQVTVVKAQPTSEALAKSSLTGLVLAETGTSSWQIPLTELALPNVTAAGSTDPTPSPQLGSYPVWTISANTPLAEALWSMSEAATTSAVISDPSNSGALIATLSVNDLKLFLQQIQKGVMFDSGNRNSNSHGHGQDHKRQSDFTDSLLEGDVLAFIQSVRRADEFASLDTIRKAKTAAERNVAIHSQNALASAPVLTVGTGASLAHVVHRLATAHAHKCYVIGATTFAPLRVISLTDILRYVVSADATEAASLIPVTTSVSK